MTTSRILVIDDNKNHAEVTAEALERIGCSCHVATSGKKGLEWLAAERYDIVITDLRIYDIDGMEILRRAKEQDAAVEVVLITGHASVTSAVEAMRSGAANYLEKPVNLENLRTLVMNLIEKQTLSRDNLDLHRALDKRYGFEGLIGETAAMQRVFDVMGQIAPTTATVLITGESGTGKELVARALHGSSPRREGPFVPINCAALASGILESELFGHEKGAFTGAYRRREGRFEAASNGTLFLDEIGDMPAETQAKLLRVLEDLHVQRVGSNTPIPVDVRIIGATNCNMATEVAAGRFREDLFFRLRVVEISLPPLRDRKADIPLLVKHCVEEFGRRHGRPNMTITPAAMKQLIRHPWPCNVRELRNVIENLVILTHETSIDEEDLPPDFTATSHSVEENLSHWTGRSLREVEQILIQNTLELTDGNREQAAGILGIGVRTLYRKIKEYDLR